ncbi:MAG: ester cyclase [Candidatus Bipolaricaulia bacterium]
MSTEENKAKTRRFYEEVLSQRNVDVLDEFIGAGFVDHNPNPGQAPGLEGVKQIFAQILVSFPDLHFTIEDMIAEGDKVTTRLTLSGTHQGEFQGIPATGKQVAMTGIDIIRIEGGKAVERWGEFDFLGMMQQLGVVPEG